MCNSSGGAVRLVCLRIEMWWRERGVTGAMFYHLYLRPRVREILAFNNRFLRSV